MRGRAPKDDDERQRRNYVPGPKVPSKWDGVVRGPELPLNLPGIKWSPVALQWWQTFRESPQAAVFTATDWTFLMDTCLLVNMYWQPKNEPITNKNGKIIKRLVPRPVSELTKLAAEIRQREEQFGVTFRHRRVLGMAVDAAEPHQDGLTDDVVESTSSTLLDYYMGLAAQEIIKETAEKPVDL